MTPNKEDYLKCIYEIGTEEGKISNKEIANRMQVSPPADFRRPHHQRQSQGLSSNENW